MKWSMFPLDKIADVFGGSTPRRNHFEYWNGDIPWVTPTDLPMPGAEIADVYETADYITPEGLRSCAANLLPIGTVLYSSRATIGKIGIARVPLATNQGFANFAPKPGVESKYLAYALQYFTLEISSLAGSTTFKEVRRGALKKYKVPLPPPSEQRRIVEILDQADALRKQRAEADAKAARILPALFYNVIGDPATNPKGWPVVPFDEVVEIGTQLVDPNQPKYINLPHVGGEHIEKETGRVLSPQLVRESNLRSNKFYFTEQHVLYSKIRPYLNKVCFPRFEGVCSADIYPLLPKDERVSPWYLIALLRSPVFLSYAKVHSERLRMPKLNKNQLGAFKTPLPDPTVLAAFDRQTKEIVEIEKARFDQRNRIDRLFATILHRAFTGDLTANWREAHMKEILAEMEEQARALECPSPSKRTPRVESKKRHAGHDMFNKAALSAYITDRCYAPDRPIGRVKLAKLFYLVQKKAEIEVTETFIKRAAGPLDDEIHKFLSLARKNKWVVLGRDQGDLKPVKPGANVSKAVKQAEKVMGSGKVKVDEMLDQMKSWGYQALERWATVLDAALELGAADGKPVTVDEIKESIQGHPEWIKKLARDEFSDEKIDAALRGLRGFGFITEQQ